MVLCETKRNEMKISTLRNEIFRKVQLVLCEGLHQNAKRNETKRNDFAFCTFQKNVKMRNDRRKFKNFP